MTVKATARFLKNVWPFFNIMHVIDLESEIKPLSQNLFFPARINESNRPEVLLRKMFLKNLQNFTGKHLSLFLL